MERYSSPQFLLYLRAEEIVEKAQPPLSPPRFDFADENTTTLKMSEAGEVYVQGEYEDNINCDVPITITRVNIDPDSPWQELFRDKGVLEIELWHSIIFPPTKKAGVESFINTSIKRYLLLNDGNVFEDRFNDTLRVVGPGEASDIIKTLEGAVFA